MELTKVQYIHEDAQLIIKEMTADLEARLGRSIAPADVEMLLINAFAYRELLLRSAINDAGRQNLVAFSRGIALDYLAQLVGVTRLEASTATCNIRFGLVAGHTGVLIPKGLRVQSLDGKAIFQVTENKVVEPGTLTVDLLAECSSAGEIGNGYDPNKISIILDPQPFLSYAQNIDITSGGTDSESDEELRERIYLAPSTFSVAGPKGAYEFFAKSAHPGIVDVAITSPVPGQVNIYPLLENGVLPDAEILASVLAICNGDKVRPLTDTVIAEAPSKVDYAIEVNLTLLNDAVNSEVLEQVNTALTGYKTARTNKLGLDVVKNQIMALCILPGKVYNVEVVQPLADIVAAPEVYTNCTGITVNVVGTSDE